MKTSACRDGTLKNQPNYMEMKPQNFHTIPTSNDLTNLTQTFQACHLCTFNVATIFLGGHPYIWCTTVCHDSDISRTKKLLRKNSIC